MSHGLWNVEATHSQGPDGFSLSAKGGMDIREFNEGQWLREMHYPKYDVTVDFMDRSRERTWFVIREDKAGLWRDLGKAVNW